MNALGKELGLNAEAVTRLHGVAGGDDNSVDGDGVLEEVSEGVRSRNKIQ